MRKGFMTLLFFALCTSGVSQESREARRCRRGQAAGYATRDATVLSMMGWGVGLAVGIATLCALIEDNPASSSSSSSNGGSSSH
jgi:hypothetical protein